MKKWFSRFEPSDAQQSVLGKQLCVGRHVVTVEDTIAEGEYCEKRILLPCISWPQP